MTDDKKDVITWGKGYEGQPKLAINRKNYDVFIVMEAAIYHEGYGYDTPLKGYIDIKIEEKVGMSGRTKHTSTHLPLDAVLELIQKSQPWVKKELAKKGDKK